MNYKSPRKVVVLGLDSAPPLLIFDRWRLHLPNLARLMGQGIYGKLRSCHPPITVPAWSSMLSGKSPGRLGLYGLRNRKDYSYDVPDDAAAQAVNDARIWDILSTFDKESILIGIPQTYPVKPMKGIVLTDFLTPSLDKEYAYPSEIRKEVENLVGPYILDVENFRTDQKDNLLKQIYNMTEQHFKLAKHFIKSKPWNFFMMVAWSSRRASASARGRSIDLQGTDGRAASKRRRVSAQSSWRKAVRARATRAASAAAPAATRSQSAGKNCASAKRSSS
ncbi:MAG: alkaline phosphatase family protein, partial [Candidatus Omnitrophica bacterium]|nr:alkaline phosphatase family protein [Candidatus Omnitrophota bacterium]